MFVCIASEHYFNVLLVIMFMLATLNYISHLNVNSHWMQFRNCLADIRGWMITNKLKMNDSKTDFLVFKSPQTEI